MVFPAVDGMIAGDKGTDEPDQADDGDEWPEHQSDEDETQHGSDECHHSDDSLSLEGLFGVSGNKFVLPIKEKVNPQRDEDVAHAQEQIAAMCEQS